MRDHLGLKYTFFVTSNIWTKISMLNTLTSRKKRKDVCYRMNKISNNVQMFKTKIEKLVNTAPGGVGKGTQQMFILEGPAPSSNPLPFLIPFFTKKVPLSYTFY